MHEKEITQYKQSEHLNTSDILQLFLHMEIPMKAILLPTWEPPKYRCITVIIPAFNYFPTPVLLTDRFFVF